MYELASHLGQPLSVILGMTVDEYHHWYTYLRIKSEREKKYVEQHRTGRHSRPSQR